jgi:PAS domain S-box-containing protein
MRKKRIMVVEDEAITAMRIVSSLEKMGYALTSAVFSAEEAIEKAADEKPDLVLMDIVLRGEKDGIEAAGQIQSRFNIPVVYITAHSDEKILKRIKKTEPFGYIVKPFNDRELHGAVEIALYKYEMEERLRESEMRYRNLFKNATDAIYLFDPDTQQIIDCNPKAAEITGYTIRELKSIKMAELYPDTEQGVVSKIFQKIRETGRLSDISGINQLTKDGELVPVEINAITIKLEGKKYGLCIIRDITRRKKAQEGRG